MITHFPREVLPVLAGHIGLGSAGDARRCETRLAELCGDAFRDERAALVAAVDHGVAGELLSSVVSSEPKGALLDRLAHLLAAAQGGLSSYLARWSVECWAVALRAVRESDRLMIVKLDRFAPLVEAAGASGTISDDDVDRLLVEAERLGLGAAEARIYLSRYAVPHGSTLGETLAAQETLRVGPPATPQPATTAASPNSESELPAIGSAGLPVALLPQAPARWGGVRWPALSVAGAMALAISVILAIALVREPPINQLSLRERQVYAAAQGNLEALRRYVGTCKACDSKSAALEEIARLETADRERQAYETARGNIHSLQRYADSCRVCGFKTAALEEIAVLRGTDEERLYRAARDNLDALQEYVGGCRICGFKTAALDEISRLRRAEEERKSLVRAAEEEERAYRAARSNPGALQQYVDTCRICGFKSAALDEISKLRTAEEEERAYRAARGNADALRRYLNSCRACGFRTAALEEIALLRAAEDEERTYRAARGDRRALQEYVNSCKECVFKSAALWEIPKLAALAKPPVPKPDLEGTVTAVKGAALIMVGNRWLPLFGIVDPTFAAPSHVDAMRRYLSPSNGVIQCFARPRGKFQCFANGKDIALLALADGIAEPSSDAPSEYARQSVQR